MRVRVSRGAPLRPGVSTLQRSPTAESSPDLAPHSVHRVLATRGQPLPPTIRQSLEPALGHDFSRVQVHVDGAAVASAAAVGARAYTVARHVVLGSDRDLRDSTSGRWLLAHELTHVAQQAGASTQIPSRLFIGPPNDAAEAEARAVADRVATARPTVGSGPATSPRGAVSRSTADASLQRDNTAETAEVAALGTTAGSGLQFVPGGLRRTRVGPVSGQGGLIHDETQRRVSVIVGGGITLRQLARSLLPLWETATPFTPEGSTTPAPRDPLDVDTLARGLMIYNRALLLPPALTGWQAGLRLPLPIEIDPDTGEGVVHPAVIVGNAGEFDATWEPLLDQGAAALATENAEQLAAAVDAFLSEQPTALDRGLALGTRAITNAPAHRDFIVAVLDRLGSQAFAVALELINNLVLHQIELLGSQTAGAAILDRLRGALATPSAQLSDDDQRWLERAQRLLSRATAVTARDTPTYRPAPAAGTPSTGPRAATDLDFSAEGARFVAGFEGFRGNLYDDAAGHCTIGFGHLVHRGNCNGTESQEFRDGIQRERALELLQADAGDAAAAVQAAVAVPLTQGQFDALVSFTFNVGAGAFRTSTLLRELNGGHYDAVPDQLLRWTRAGGVVLQGLERRRTAEGNLFRSGAYE